MKLSKDVLNGFSAKAEENLAKLGQAGMVVSIVKDDETIYTGAFGYSDVENKKPPNAHTLYPIGSATKAFTATALMILASRGKLDIDKPVREYMPELQFMDTQANNATTRDLLSHRTGLPRHDTLWIMRPYISRKEIPSLIRHLPPSKPFRTTYQYNNLMFVCAGRLVEILDGRCWEDFIAEEIFAPLGMKRANFTPEASIVDGNFALCYDRDLQTKKLFPIEYSFLGGMAPAGAIFADVTELCSWNLFNLNGSRTNGKASPLLPKELFAQLFTPNTYTPPEIFNEPEIHAMGYSLGWEVQNYRGYKLINHGGNVNGGSAMIAFMPEINAGVNIMVNTGSSVLTYATMYDTFDRLLGLADKKDWAAKLGDVLDKLIEQLLSGGGQLKAIQKKVKTSRMPKEFAGTYSHPAYGQIRIEEKDKSLRTRIAGFTSVLENLHYDIFIAKISMGSHDVEIPFAFQSGIDGKIVSFEAPLEGSAPPIVFRREPEIETK